AGPAGAAVCRWLCAAEPGHQGPPDHPQDVRRHVFNSLDSLYADVNELLANAGVLPDLKQGGPVRRPRAERPAPAASRPAATTGAVDDGAEQQQVLSIFSELISSWRHVSGDVALSALGAPSAPPVRSDELLGMLNHFAS